MLRVGLVGVLGFLVRENQIECDLISLVHNRAVTGRHSADVEMKYTGNRLKVLIGAGDQLVGCGWYGGFSPKDNNV